MVFQKQNFVPDYYNYVLYLPMKKVAENFFNTYIIFYHYILTTKNRNVKHIRQSFTKRKRELFTDGSCFWPAHNNAARASWTALQLDEKDEVRAAAQGTVAGCCHQTAVGGEHHALLHGAGAAEWGGVTYGQIASLF